MIEIKITCYRFGSQAGGVSLVLKQDTKVTLICYWAQAVYLYRGGSPNQPDNEERECDNKKSLNKHQNV